MRKTLEKIKNLLSRDLRLIIGLDVDINKLPVALKNEKNPIYKFNKEIINECSEFCAGYKFNLAFYESYGAAGIEELLMSIEEVPHDKIIIGDGKRADIGNTSQKYSEAYFDVLKFDCSTLNPYMGLDSLLPFLQREDKFHFILALTSNQGASDFQKIYLQNNLYLYQFVLQKINEWNKEYRNCGAVFGATNLEELKNNSDLLKDIIVLLPGVGAQGASAKQTADVLFEKGISNFFINASRSIIYKDSSINFAVSARKEAEKMRLETTKG